MDTEIDTVDDVEADNGDALLTESSSWTRTALEITDIVDSEVTVVYLDFVRDKWPICLAKIMSVRISILAKWH